MSESRLWFVSPAKMAIFCHEIKIQIAFINPISQVDVIFNEIATKIVSYSGASFSIILQDA